MTETKRFFKVVSVKTGKKGGKKWFLRLLAIRI